MATDKISRITVRMYEVGFGDCFLVQFWTGEGQSTVAKRVLIDCGSITEGKAQVDKVVADVIANCKDGDGRSRIDLVVGTHRHKDHVGGFANADWARVEVGEVWMPWTEDPNDERATYVRNRQSGLAMALTRGLTLDEPLVNQPDRESKAKASRRAQQAMALNALTNEKAMATLHSGFATRPKREFLPRKETLCEARTVAGLGDGVQIHVLGPPRDEKAMSIMDPPSGAGYLTQSGHAGRPSTPFAARWAVSEATWRASVGDTTFAPEDIKAVDGMADQPMGELAAALDNALNNTSLILVVEAAGHCMLFPADAQWGAWDAALKNPQARALLQRSNFLKVGHHGSHNATPKTLIEDLMAPGFEAMFSTCSVKQWPDIPRKPLLAAMTATAKRYARSDDEKQAKAAGFVVEPGLYIELELPAI